MKTIWERMKAKWTLVAILATGVLGCAFLPFKAFKDVTQELIALFGLMMAGVLPTMVLTASVLRAGNLSVKKLSDYSAALRQQMTIWIGLFVISLASSLLVVVGKMVDWSLPVPIPLDWAGLQSTSFDAIRILNGLIVMALTLVLFRAVAVGNGIISLLRLSSEIALSEAKARDEARHTAAEQAIAGIAAREGYGDYVDVKH